VILALAGAAALASGACSLEFKGLPTEYHLSARSREILRDDPEAQTALASELRRLFGTREAPAFAAPAERLNRRRPVAEIATTGEAQAGPEREAPPLASSAALYAEKCLYCHGNEGGGDGVTSSSLSPKPRDFRLGVYKYDNIQDGGRPELIDFVRIITRGIEGTAMPSMKSHSEAEIFGLAEYARLLAMRGETEAWLAAEVEPGVAIDDERADETYRAILELWLDEERTRFHAPGDEPPISEGSIRRGFELFHDSDGAACASCHGARGEGRGPAAWGLAPDGPDHEVALLRDQWGHEAEPRDLVHDIFLHGDDPRTLFERLYLGIDGTPMAGIGTALGADGKRLFSTEDIWDLVHYVSALRDPRWRGLTGQLADNTRAAR